jgi:hypothetical protein
MFSVFEKDSATGKVRAGRDLNTLAELLIYVGVKLRAIAEKAPFSMGSNMG